MGETEMKAYGMRFDDALLRRGFWLYVWQPRRVECPRFRRVETISLNTHAPLDLSPFGLENPNALFMPREEPYGSIEATVKRGEVA